MAPMNGAVKAGMMGKGADRKLDSFSSTSISLFIPATSEKRGLPGSHGARKTVQPSHREKGGIR